MERAESRASEQRAKGAVKEANLSDQCLVLKRELEATQVIWSCLSVRLYLYRSLQHDSPLGSAMQLREHEMQQEHVAALGKMRQRVEDLEVT